MPRLGITIALLNTSSMHQANEFSASLAFVLGRDEQRKYLYISANVGALHSQ